MSEPIRQRTAEELREVLTVVEQFRYPEAWDAPNVIRDAITELLALREAYPQAVRALRAAWTGQHHHGFRDGYGTWHEQVCAVCTAIQEVLATDLARAVPEQEPSAGS